MKYRAHLRIRNATYLDTGYYICYQQGGNETDDDQSTRTYLYIEGMR